jgi:hypothetical protein
MLRLGVSSGSRSVVSCLRQVYDVHDRDHDIMIIYQSLPPNPPTHPTLIILRCACQVFFPFFGSVGVFTYSVRLLPESGGPCGVEVIPSVDLHRDIR